MTASAPAWAVWTMAGLWVVALITVGCAVVAGRRLWRQLRPAVEPMLVAFGFASGLADAAQRDDAEPDEAVGATLDICEYGEHEWRTLLSPQLHGLDVGAAHYCIHCGFTEPLPGV